MLRTMLGILILIGCVVAFGLGRTSNGDGPTTDFAEAGRAAHSYMKSDVVPAIGTARFPTVIAASRARVKLVQQKIKGDVDEGVWLILMMVNVKANEANSHREMAGLPAMQSRAAREAWEDVTNEREYCMSEADGWLNGTLNLRILKAGPCLQQAKLAAKILLKK